MNRQSGNALFLILIAVALFATLSYALTQSGRGGGSSDKENAELKAANILSFANTLTYAVQRTLIIAGADITELYFNNDTYEAADGSNFNGTMGTPVDPSLYMFHPQGGGVVPLTFEDATATSCGSCGASRLLGGHFAIRWIAIPGVGTSLPELTLFGAQFSDDVCTAINRKSGISPDIPDATVVGGNYHTNGAAAPTSGGLGGTEVASLSGKTDFCFFTYSTSQRNLFIHVIKEY